MPADDKYDALIQRLNSLERKCDRVLEFQEELINLFSPMFARRVQDSQFFSGDIINEAAASGKKNLLYVKVFLVNICSL